MFILIMNVAKTLDGCWGGNLFDTKIAVERCGCNSGSKLTGSLVLLVSIGVGVCMLMLG